MWYWFNKKSICKKFIKNRIWSRNRKANKKRWQSPWRKQIKKDGKAPEESVLETDGTNLAKIFEVDEVDFTRTISNDINEIYNVLGIEAVRRALLDELRKVLKPYGIYVNYRHISILCDLMTQRGILTSITRHGLNRSEYGPIRKATFEETVEILLEAGIFAEKDDLKGISNFRRKRRLKRNIRKCLIRKINKNRNR